MNILINIKSYLLQIIFVCILANGAAYADWNHDFDVRSSMLSQAIPCLQNPQYLQDFENFKNVREELVNDPILISQLQKADIGKKLMILKKKLHVIIKKRRNNHIHDLYAWELSYLLGSDEYVLPSFPMEIGGVRVIVQRLEPFEFGNYLGDGYSRGTLEKISLETYWKAHIQAYILGFSDLAAANIGVSSKGIIRFFDNEACLIYYNIPFKTDSGFSTGFICQSFDWEQFNTPLDSSTARKLRSFIDSFCNFEENFNTYRLYRPIDDTLAGIQHRLDILRNFDIQKGTTFHDLYSKIFPRINSGLDELNQIANGILKRKVGYGTTLFFACRPKRDIKLTDQDRAAIRQWVATYVE